MMGRTGVIVGSVLLLALALLGATVFTVGEAEKGIKFRLGKIIDTDLKPGLHFKIPFIDTVNLYNARLLTLESKPESFLTSEKKTVVAAYFAKWQIKDVAKFYTSVQGDETQAKIRLDQIIQAAMKGDFSKRTMREVVTSERDQIRDILIAEANPFANEMGVDIVDIGIMRINFSSDVNNSVFRRMEAERSRVAHDSRARGEETAERIRADADRQREVILGDAYRDAELKRGEGDTTAAEIYALAYGKDKDFFSFYRSLNAYKQMFKNDSRSIILEPDSEFFQYFKKSK